MPSQKRSFGMLDGRDVSEIELSTPDGGMTAKVIELGAAVRDLAILRADGVMQRVVLGLNSPSDYREHSPHMGAIAGRFGNRIGGGRFTLDGVQYRLPLNENGRNTLHGGGVNGFGKSCWTVLNFDAASAIFALHSPAGDQGFPGALTVTCRISLVPPQTLRIELTAVTDAPTVINLCHHSYFKLDGQPDILDHRLTVHADLYAPIDAHLIPYGTLAAVAGTPLDFRAERPLRDVDADAPRTPIDNTYILRRERIETGQTTELPLAHAASVSSTRSGVRMECWTTEPALQVYDGSKVNVPVAGLDGVRYGACAGLALEPQHVPDSPNLPHFPSTVLRPSGVYRQRTEYRFT